MPTSAPKIPPSPPKKFPPPSPPQQLPGGRGPFNRRLTDGSEWPMGSSVGTGRRLNPASARAGRGRAGGERGAGLGTCQPIGVRREAAGAGGGARQGDDVTWSEWRAAPNAESRPRTPASARAGPRAARDRRDGRAARWEERVRLKVGATPGGAFGLQGGVNAGSASAPDSAIPAPAAPASEAARGTPTPPPTPGSPGGQG